jgi:hypothetical protein
MDAKAKGAKLVLIDPVHHKTAASASAFSNRPGGDFRWRWQWRILFEKNWIDPQAPATAITWMNFAA